MTQATFDLNEATTGSALITQLEGWRDAVQSSNKGASRPSYIVSGMQWLDDSVSPWLLKMYDGVSDCVIGTINPTTHIFTPYNGGAEIVEALPGNLRLSGKWIENWGTINITGAATQIVPLTFSRAMLSAVYKVGTTPITVDPNKIQISVYDLSITGMTVKILNQGASGVVLWSSEGV